MREGYSQIYRWSIPPSPLPYARTMPERIENLTKPAK